MENSSLQDDYYEETPLNYRHWIARAEKQEDDYAKFFMFYIAVVISEDSNIDKEYKKINSFGLKVEKKFKSIERTALLAKNLSEAIDEMLAYIQESRGGKQIINLNKIIPRGALIETKFNRGNHGISESVGSIFLVRNNLFHGDKGAYNENDIKIIRKCNSILKASLDIIDAS